MPLLNGEPFHRHPLPQEVNPNQEIYFCESTTEGFASYDEFFEKAILCSSMAWTCALTGRSELTFQEAVESEAAAHSSLDSVSVGLQRAMLLLTRIIPTTKFNDICHFLWAYTSCRFFVNEEVEVMHHNVKKTAKIMKVVPPNSSTWDSLSDVCFGADPSGFKYDVMSTSESKKPFRMMCPANGIVRPAGNLSKDKVKLFMKQHTDTYKRQTITILKEQSMKLMRLDKLKWDDVFAGPAPSLDPEDESLPTRKHNKAKGASATKTPNRRKQSLGSDKKSKPGPKPLSVEEKKLRQEEQRKKIAEKKRKEREKAREEKMKHAKQQAEWSRKRDDLECDDLKPLTSGFPIHCEIPNALFGDAVAIMEFYHNFSEFFELKEIFPHGFTFDLLQRILCEKSIKSPISDLIRITLATIFCLQEEEDAEDNKKDDKNEFNIVIEAADGDDDEAGGDDLRTAMNQALKLQNVLKRVHGQRMSLIELTPLTVSEVLRLHFLTSGAPRARSVYRGWFFSREDPALLFRIERPDVIDKLSKVSVYELEADEKIGIFHALMNQVMSFPAFREIVDVTIDKIVELRKEMRSAQAEFGRWERENAVRRTRKEGDVDAAADGHTEPTAEETDEAIAAFTVEREKRLITLEKEQQERRKKIRKYEAQYGIKPIGRDRAFRRYWIFNSIDGLFIEQDDPFTGLCLGPHDSGNMKSLSCSPTNNKENEFGDKSDRSSSGSASSSHSSLICTGNSSTCLIHSASSSVKYKWRFCADPADVQELINCLNERGFRESELSQALKVDIKLYQTQITNCPVGRLNTDIPAESRRDRLVYYKASMTGMSHIEKEPAVALKMMFLDHLSSFEEQLFSSGLSFRPNSCLNRDQWKSCFQIVDPNKADFVNKIKEALEQLASVIPVSNLRDDWSIAKWNELLDETSSLSRLFFLLSVLESKIDFPKHVSLYCRVCRRKKDAENMLLCDSCNGAHHTYCLKPPLEHVPKGNWFCPKCKQVPKVPKSPRKPVTITEDDEVDEIYTITSSHSSSRQTTDVEESEESNDATEVDNGESDDEAALCAACGSADDDPDEECTACGRKYHFSCHVPKIPNDTKNWRCCKCAPSRGTATKRKDVVEEEDSGRPKRTRIVLRNTAFGQTPAATLKIRTSGRSTRSSDDDSYNKNRLY